MATLPGFMAGVVTNQQANTAGGSRQDNGSAHYVSAKPSKTPTGATKGIVGANASGAFVIAQATALQAINPLRGGGTDTAAAKYELSLIARTAARLPADWI